MARRMRTQAEWKVTPTSEPPDGHSSATRLRISSAALLVKVMASICHVGVAVAIRWAIRRVSTGLARTGPATMSSGPPGGRPSPAAVRSGPR